MKMFDVIGWVEKCECIVLEMLEIYVLFVCWIGINWVCVELEDLVFKYVNLVVYEFIIWCFKLVCDQYIEEVVVVFQVIIELLMSYGIDVWIFGCQKWVYLIWCKLDCKGLIFDEIVDIYVFWLIVLYFDDCYWVMGVIYQIWCCVLECFCDFILVFKLNNYCFLYIMVIGLNSVCIELQICIEEMELVVESGVVVYWCYKNEIYKYDLDVVQVAGGDFLECLCFFVEIFNQGGDLDEFFEYVKFEMFVDQVYCFMFKGDFILLLIGVMLLDFVYVVYIELGYIIVVVKINGWECLLWM